jgi:hypothetical protein
VKRFIMVLSLMAVMVAMVAVMAAPAFANRGGVKPPFGYCEHGQAPFHAKGGPGVFCGLEPLNP